MTEPASLRALALTRSLGPPPAFASSVEVDTGCWDDVAVAGTDHLGLTAPYPVEGRGGRP